MPQIESFTYVQNLLPIALVVGLVLLGIGRPWMRRLVIIMSGTFALAVIAPRLAVLHLAFWAVVSALRRIVASSQHWRVGFGVFWVCLVVAASPMLCYKVFPRQFTIQANIWPNHLLRWLAQPIATLDFSFPILVPIGVSFASFRAIDLLIKTRIGLIERLPHGSTMAYGVFAPLLLVGPIAEYEEVAPALDGTHRVTAERAGDHLVLLVRGLLKVFALALPLQWSSNMFRDWQINTTPRLLLSLIAFGWYFYLNFSGYSDVATAAARWMGAEVRDNFRHPYLKTNPAQFWNSWHISLTRFLQRNVFVPLGGSRKRRQPAATMVTMLLIGLWHDLSWGTLIFGLYHGTSLVAHRAAAARRPARTSSVLRVTKPLAVFGWYVISLPMIFMPSSQLLGFYRALLPGSRFL